MKIDLEQIRELLSVVGATDITELTIEFGDQRITVKKSPPVLPAEPSSKPIAVKTEIVRETVDTSQHSAPAKALVAVENHPAPVSLAATQPMQAITALPPPTAGGTNGFIEITSPMVGTFYSSPSPDKPPFVNVGDHVKIGDTVCIIEAMKLMNDMPAEVTGKIVRVMVENGTTVEYGQPLFLVDPRG